MRSCNQGIEIPVVAKTRIDPVEIDGVVTMTAGLENRCQKKSGRTEFDGVIQPSGQLR